MRKVSLRVLALTGLLVLLSAAGFAQVVKPASSYLDTLAFKDLDLDGISQLANSGNNRPLHNLHLHKQ